MTDDSRLQWVLEHIDTIAPEREHTSVPVADLRLLRAELDRLRAEVQAGAQALLRTHRILSAKQAQLDKTTVIARAVADGDVYHDSKGGMLIVAAPDALLAKARALLADKG